MNDFKLVESSFGANPPPRVPVAEGYLGLLVGERKVRRVATAASMRASIAILLGAGVGLGGLDMIIVGSVIYAVPWVAVAGVGSFLLWLRYGRTYESEVIEVSAALTPPRQGGWTSGAPNEPTAEVDWRVGRIRSVAFSGARAAVDVVDCPVSLIDSLVRAVRSFQSGGA